MDDLNINAPRHPNTNNATPIPAATTEAREFKKVYSLGVTAIPTHRPVQRTTRPDGIYRTIREKYEAVAREDSTSTKLNPEWS